ncbi:hypothetical protein M433DRAFT_1210 [Acidomyces richmondensis BFW]|nr:MAG: hypothetical protein FE78DRAFT_34405 [Acidomyces sp. 'richmondensis']KYG49329.1 hypothetical protein M433DRAFT_1210 [Acidomyces richmondensis BFW]
MLDAFEVVTTSGIVLWRRHYAPVAPALLNAWLADVLIEEKAPTAAAANTARRDRYTLKWTTAKELGLVFVAVYQSLVSLSWVDRLLAAAKALFVQEYGAVLRPPHPATAIDSARFDAAFDALVRKLDPGRSATAAEGPDSDATADPTPPSSSNGDDDAAAPPLRPCAALGQTAEVTPVPTPDTSRPTTPSQTASHLLVAKSAPGKVSRRARKAQNPLQQANAPLSSGDETTSRKAGKGVKPKRRWDAEGLAAEGDDGMQLDYSGSTTADISADNIAARDPDVNDVHAAQMGRRTGQGQFVLKDLDDEVDAILAAQKASASSTSGNALVDSADGDGGSLLQTTTSRIAGLFRNVVGGQTLTAASLAPALQQMRTHLLAKNVAREAADRLCAAVEADLLNSSTARFTSVEQTLRASMIRALTRILTPTNSLDLLRDVQATICPPSARPYVISIVGVNGVGKSTNLSKIAYFLLQNQLRVLVVAADTFRSGAVEQLRVHVRNLSELARREEIGRVELFEKGYGKDAATVARDAVAYATNSGGEMRFDVVLIDTAGRRHNDTRLMSSLTKFGQLANPDKIFMVGEALVGSDSVAQARNFAREFVDSKGQLRNNGVGMDGFIISKCDTVGDMVGTLVSMVHATGIPVVFLGVGQHYGDLRGLNVGWAVEKLMR